MNKIFLLAFVLCFSMHSFGLELDELSYKSVFRNLYSGIFTPVIEDDDFSDKELKNIGVVSNNKKYLAFYHTPEQYLNVDGEVRYLLHIERRDISENEKGSNRYHFSETCHACVATDDLFIFKKDLVSNKFTLLSKTPRTFAQRSSFGVSEIDASNLEKRIVKIKSDAVGFFNTYTYANHGEEVSFLDVIILNEASPIAIKTVDEYAGNNQIDYDKDSPLAYSYSSTYKVLNNDKTSFNFYPVELKFSGDNRDENFHGFIKYNKIKKYKMQSDGEYSETSSIDY